MRWFTHRERSIPGAEARSTHASGLVQGAGVLRGTIELLLTFRIDVLNWFIGEAKGMEVWSILRAESRDTGSSAVKVSVRPGEIPSLQPGFRGALIGSQHAVKEKATQSPPWRVHCVPSDGEQTGRNRALTSCSHLGPIPLSHRFVISERRSQLQCS